MSETDKTYYELHREQRNLQNAEYNNRPEVKEYHRIYNKQPKFKQYQKDYQEQHKEELNANALEYYHEHFANDPEYREKEKI